MKKEKGFTLIELLAVIVILAILMVIAVPKILNVIENSRKSAAEISAKMYIDSINKLSTLNSFDSNEYKIIEDGENIDVSSISDKVKIKGTKPTFGKVTIVNKKVTKAYLCVDNYMVNYDGVTTKASNGCDVIISNIIINAKENIKKEIFAGETIKLSVTTDPENVKVDYKSSDETIATVNADGIITGIGNGTVIITAYKKDIEDKIEISVKKPDIYVAVDGNDETGDGTMNNPYASLKNAIEKASSGNTIFIKAGIYELSPIYYDSMESSGIYDIGKELNIYGENEKTILKFDNSSSTRIDGVAIRLANKNSIVGNFVYIFKPTKDKIYSNAIFHRTYGTTKNVFFMIDNTSKSASYDYFNNEKLTHTVENCTFYHTKGSVSNNYSGSGIYKNIATNANPTGTLENVINESFTTEKTDIKTMINDSKNNKSFNSAIVGVFYGKNAWK